LEPALMTDAETFESHRSTLLALAYRMLGDMGRAEDVVQEAWLRWQNAQTPVTAPRAFLITTVTHLCLDDLTSARARREEPRSRLPEPVDLQWNGIAPVEMADQISMAFLVVLQRLTPAERAVLLLHEVFDVSHEEIARMLGKTVPACRQLLSRAREHVAEERRTLETSEEEHRRLLLAFVRAIRDGEVEPLFDLLSEDAVFFADNPGERYGRIRSVRRPVVGRVRIAALVKAISSQSVPKGEVHERSLNGQPAAVLTKNGRVVLAILVAVADGRIRRVFLQADPERLRHVGPLN
jgi:RNA polymerase sigma-70 factor, ECF subfamily